MISRKSWVYVKTFSKRLRVVKNQTLFTAARECGSTVLTRGICCSPTSLKDRRKICLSFFLRRKRGKNTRARSEKKSTLYIVYICLCDETIHSYERKTNGVKRERVLRFAARFERADIQMRSRVQNTVEKRSSLSCAFGCFFLCPL